VPDALLKFKVKYYLTETPLTILAFGTISLTSTTNLLKTLPNRTTANRWPLTAYEKNYRTLLFYQQYSICSESMLFPQTISNYFGCKILLL
jgi:hypothetical protein